MAGHFHGWSFLYRLAVNRQPIGIFDSGVGGLTVASAIRQLMPDESFIYYGDTAHNPYGEKSVSAIREYSFRITEFLLSKGAKAILVACNTVSSSAFESLKEEFGGKVLIMDVIDPVVNYVALTKYSKIGVIGTKRTIGSGTYEQKIKSLAPEKQVVSLATPLLAPMIEEGYVFDDISNAILRSYLSNDMLKGIDALILGCTHYPIIKNQIRKIFDFDIDIIDSSGIVSSYLKTQLEKHNLRNGSGDVEYHFYVSDFTPYFEKIARMFFEGDINLQKAEIRK